MPTDPRLLPFLPAARASHAKFYPRGPFISIILGQLALESAYGTRLSGRNNFFGVKATHTEIALGCATLVTTREFAYGRYMTEDLYFADYDTPEICFDAHGALLCTPHYQPCMDAGTPAAYARALQACGYATAPTYARVLMDVITSNDLYAYDEVPNLTSAPAPTPLA